MHTSFRSTSGYARPLVLAALSLAIVGALALPQSATAGGFQLKENSAKGMGRAYAGSTTAGDDASVVINNPAAMSDLKGTYAQFDMTGINFGTHFHGSAHDALGRPISGDNGGDGGTTLPVPAMVFVTQVSDKVHLGAGFSVPFGFQTEYNRNWVGRYQAIKSKIQTFDATLSGSYELTDSFSLGASFIAQKTNAELTNAINYNMVGLGLIQQSAAAGQISPAMAQALAAQVSAVVPPGSDGFARIKGDDWAYGWQVGAYYKLTPNDRFAVDYHSKITHSIQGTGNFTVPDNVAALLSNPAVAPLLGGGTPFQHTNATAGFTTPEFVSLSYWHQTEKYGVGADASWTRWDRLKQLEVNYDNPAQPPSTQKFGWHNSWVFSVGGDYYLNDKLTLRAGIAMDKTPTSAALRDPRVPDALRKEVAFGVGYKASEHFELDASYMHIFVNKAVISGALSATGDTLTGYSDAYGNLLSVSAQYKF